MASLTKEENNDFFYIYHLLEELQQFFLVHEYTCRSLW